MNIFPFFLRSGFQYSDDVQEFFDILLSAQAPQMVSDFLANVPDLKSRLGESMHLTYTVTLKHFKLVPWGYLVE